MINRLQSIKEQLFDAPKEVKESFNNVVEYFGKGGYGKGGRSSSTKLRSIKGILEVIKEKGLTDKNLYYALRDDKLYQDAYYGYGESLLVEVNYTVTDRSKETLYVKLKELREKLFNKYPEIRNEYLDAEESIKNENLERERKRKDEELKRKELELARKIKREEDLGKEFPGLLMLRDFGKAYYKWVRLNPWMAPKKNFKEVTPVKMKPGEAYVIKRGTYYKNGRGEGLHFPSVIVYEGDEKVRIILESGFYGSSSWCIIPEEKGLVEYNESTGIPLKEFINANKTELLKLTADLNKMINEYKESNGDYVPEFDPNWGMN